MFETSASWLDAHGPINVRLPTTFLSIDFQGVARKFRHAEAQTCKRRPSRSDNQTNGGRPSP